MLDIHVFESVLVFVCNQLVVQCLFEVDSFDIKENDHAVVVAAETHAVVRVSVFDVNIDFLVDHISWCTHFGEQVKGNIFETEIAGNVKGCSAKLIPLLKQL